MRKITVLHLTEDLKVGGMEKTILYICNRLNSEKYQCKVWCMVQKGELADELIHQGVEVKVLNITSYINPFSILKLVLFLKKANPDIIHTHTYFTNTIGRIAAKIPGFPENNFLILSEEDHPLQLSIEFYYTFLSTCS